jgi:hypothetical protein
MSTRYDRNVRYSLELTDEQSALWRAAAKLRVTSQERNLALYVRPLIDLSAELDLAGPRTLNLLRLLLGLARLNEDPEWLLRKAVKKAGGDPEAVLRESAQEAA